MTREIGDARCDRPLLLLDVDGVLNALPYEASGLRHWSHWEQGWATADGRAWPVLFAPEAVAVLVGWHDSGRADLQWLTTWGHDANGELKELLGMPALVVAGTYRDDTSGAEVETAAPSHAGAAPSAPDPLSGRWWKYDVVRRAVEREPGRLVIWVDDELHEHSEFRSWAGRRGVVAVGPDPATGLRPADLEQIEQAISRGAARI